VKARVRFRAEIEPERLSAFRAGVLRFYRQNARDLPWRRTRDPYHILVSEILLHQTQVQTVIPVYEAFLARFPDVFALAAADPAEVRAITDPLGYKIRGQWLQEIARAVVGRFGGRIPDEVETLLTLPGVGRYTAGAVASFAYGKDAPIVDTNVERLLSRVFAVERVVPDRPRALRAHHLWALAAAVIPPGQGAEFNQALMEMGALVCTARRPACIYCEINRVCASGPLAESGSGHAAEVPPPYRVEPVPAATATRSPARAATGGKVSEAS
jgi:A/G-specific adenine glycosylase